MLYMKREHYTEVHMVTGYEITNLYTRLKLNNGSVVDITRLTGPNSLLEKKTFNPEHSVNDGIETFPELDD